MLKIKEKIIEKLIKNLWIQYKSKLSQVKLIENAIKKKGDTWNEDHMAFRTLPGKYCGLHNLQSVFEMIGYIKQDDYYFKDKKVKAISMVPPLNLSERNSAVPPKVFISEIEAKNFSTEFQNRLQKYTQDLVASPIEKLRLEFHNLRQDPKKIDDFVNSLTLYLSNGPFWKVPTYHDYDLLRKESEYAAWTLIYGNTPNHFTVSVHLMKKFKSLKSFNDFVIKNLGVQMNDTGRIIKGSKEVKLEQSATLAEHLLVPFQDGLRKIPYAFIEFAFRYPLQNKRNDGKWDSYYQGFVTDNADKIFESTNLRKQG